MPVSMVTIDCPCCGREVEVILVGSAHTEMEATQSPKKRGRKSRTQKAFEGLVDGGETWDEGADAQAPKSAG